MPGSRTRMNDRFGCVRREFILLPGGWFCVILSRLTLAEMSTFGNRTTARVVVIAGPTAVGKTAVAIELASMVGGEIVSADSMAVYKGMDIGTAKPTAEEQARVGFHLIDVADPSRSFSVGEFQRLAQQAIDECIDRNPPAIVVGGSGLYVRAAIDGLDESMPEADAEFRQKLNEQARTHGNEWVHAKLAEVDPKSAELIHPNNLKRVIRALEIHQATGVPASVAFELDSRRARRYPDARFFGLTMDRNELYARIDKRVDAMIDAGLTEEVSRLLAGGVDETLTSLQGLGYKEIASYLRGELGLEEAVDLIRKNTRRFAKRQYTWFKADPRIEWIDVDGLTANEVSKKIKESLSNE